MSHKQLSPIGNGDNESVINLDERRSSYKTLPYSVTRQILKQGEMEEITGYDRKKTGKGFCESLRSLNAKEIVKNFCPVFQWLPNYPVSKYLMSDIVSGFTVAIMHIPQGMAYGLLAGVDPIVGLYMAFFPTLIYFLFGTSRHISMGTFAVVSLMTSKIVATYSDPNYGKLAMPMGNLTGELELNATTTDHYPYTPFQVATAVSMVTGFYHLIMCALRLGALTSLLSEALISGFTTAAAIHVLTSQLKDVLGVSVPRHKGAFKVILTWLDILKNIGSSNSYTIYVAICCIVFMALMNEIVKPYAAKRCKFPLPTELMAVVGFTLISYILNLGGEVFHVKEVGEIPTGLPMPHAPPFELLKLVAVDSIAVTIVSYSVVMSMGMIFAQKEQYEVRPNQELLALGLSNIVGSFFSCIPLSCSLSRSVIQHQAGGKTQLASVFSAGIILIVLLWVGPIFESLPRAALAGIIIVALKGMLMQVKDLKKFKREGFLEMTVWIATFVVVVIIDIDIGLMTGVLVSLVALYLKGFKSYSCLLGQVPGTDIYIDIKTHRGVTTIPDIKIFHYVGSINFASRSGFKKDLFATIGVDSKALRRASISDPIESHGLGTGLKTLIIDLSAVAHLDTSGCKMLTEVKNSLKLIDVKCFLANASDCVYDSLLHASQIVGEPAFEIFSTVHDAVLFAQKPETLTEVS